MTPAKFSIERMVAASTRPSAPSARLETASAASASSRPAPPGHNRTAGRRIIPTTRAWAVPSPVAPKALPSVIVLRRIGATSSIRSTPASRSVTVDSDASSEPNITTMPSSPGAM